MKNLSTIGVKPHEKPDTDLKSNNLRVNKIRINKRY